MPFNAPSYIRGDAVPTGLLPAGILDACAKELVTVKLAARLEKMARDAGVSILPPGADSDNWSSRHKQSAGSTIGFDNSSLRAKGPRAALDKFEVSGMHAVTGTRGACGSLPSCLLATCTTFRATCFGGPAVVASREVVGCRVAEFPLEGCKVSPLCILCGGDGCRHRPGLCWVRGHVLVRTGVVVVLGALDPGGAPCCLLRHCGLPVDGGWCVGGRCEPALWLCAGSCRVGCLLVARGAPA